MARSESVAGSGPSDDRRFVFGDFEVDLQRGSLARCGEEVALRPKSFAVLLYLLQHANRLVPREELLAAVWPGLVVTEDSLAQCLIELRRALGDDTRSVIRTVPRRGLIFDLPVHRENSAAAPPRRRGWAARYRWVPAAALAAVAILLLWRAAGPRFAEAPAEAAAAPPETRAIAVLRFADLSPGGDQAWLADGLSEEIMHRLAQSRTLRVIGRTSAFAAEGLPVAAIAGQLGVTHVLEGSLRRQGDTVRVTAQLIDAATSLHVWSKTYDREFVDILALQEEIARTVADSLQTTLGDTDVGLGIDPRAHALYLEGRYFYLRRAEGDLERARDRFEQAVAISPEFARAWVGLAAMARASLHEADRNHDPRADREALGELLRHAVEQALRFGSELPEAHIRAARYYYWNGEQSRWREHVEIARSLDPEHWLVRMTLAVDLSIAGRIEESIPLIRHEIQRDPLNLALRDNLVGHLIMAHRFEDAQAELGRALELVASPPGRTHVLSEVIPLLQILRGDFAAAALSIESLPQGSARSRLLAINQHALAQQAESDAALAQLAAAADTPWGLYYIAEVHAFRGEGATAMNRLRRIDRGPACDRLSLAQFIYYSPLLAKLDGNADWEDYRAGILQYMQDCRSGLEINRPAAA